MDEGDRLGRGGGDTREAPAHGVGLWDSLLGAYFVLLGLFFAARQFTLMKGQQHWNLTFDLVTYWDSELMNRSRAAIMEINSSGGSLANEIQQSASSNPGHYLDLLRVGTFFEHLRFAVEKRAIDQNTVSELLGEACKNYFELYSEYKEAVKEDQPKLFEYFKKLADKC